MSNSQPVITAANQSDSEADKTPEITSRLYDGKRMEGLDDGFLATILRALLSKDDYIASFPGGLYFEMRAFGEDGVVFTDELRSEIERIVGCKLIEIGPTHGCLETILRFPEPFIQVAKSDLNVLESKANTL